MNRVLGIALVVLALGIAIVPHYTDCQSQGNVSTLANGRAVPMKCHWAGVAEAGVAAPLAVVGVVAAVNRRKSNLLGMGVLGVVLGALAIGFPTAIIGVCPNPAHICATTMKPALLSMGSLAAAASLGLMAVAARSRQ